jgi:hypothetical protein
MSYSIRSLMTAALSSVLILGGTIALAEDAPSQKDLSVFVCKDIMRLSGSERESALALVHGYRLGKMDTTKYDIETLSDLTDRFIDFCLDNPDANALAAFEKLGK